MDLLLSGVGNDLMVEWIKLCVLLTRARVERQSDASGAADSGCGHRRRQRPVEDGGVTGSEVGGGRVAAPIARAVMEAVLR